MSEKFINKFNVLDATWMPLGCHSQVNRKAGREQKLQNSERPVADSPVSSAVLTGVRYGTILNFELILLVYLLQYTSYI